MGPMKRPAAAPIDHVAKMAKTVPAKCKGIKKALLGAEGYPSDVLGMLSGSVEAIMGACKEERHKFQAASADMVSSVLKGVEAAADAAVAAAQAKVDELSGQRGERDAAAEAAAAAQAAKKEATKEKKEAEVKAVADLKAAKAALAGAKDAQAAGDAELEATAAKKEKLEAFFAGPFEAMKAGTTDAGATKEGCAAVLKIGKEYKFDDSLLQSLPSALHKAPDVRGSFDTLCLTQVEDEFKSHIGTLAAAVTAGEPAKAERAAAVAAAETALAAAEATEQAGKAALAEAKKEEKEADEALKAAKQSVKDFKPQLKEACDALDSAAAGLKELKEGALTPFTELMEWSNVPPPEPEPVPEEPEAPAAAEPVAETAAA